MQLCAAKDTTQAQATYKYETHKTKTQTKPRQNTLICLDFNIGQTDSTCSSLVALLVVNEYMALKMSTVNCLLQYLNIIYNMCIIMCVVIVRFMHMFSI